jgi:lactam utilization protein B
LCVHGDEASGVAVARGIGASLEEAGIAIVPLPDMQL